MKKDIKDRKQIRAIAVARGWDDRRRQFGEYIHRQKAKGNKVSRKKGDYSWQELNELANLFEGKGKEDGGQDQDVGKDYGTE